MSVYRRYHNAAHLTACSGILLYAVSAQAPGVGVLGVLLTFFAWGYFMNRVVSPVPRSVINVGLLIATVYMFLRVTSSPTQEAITILSEYLVVLLLIKLFENRTPRDQAQSLAICGMLAVGAVLTQPGIWTGLVLVVHLLLLLIASVRFQLWAGHHATLSASNTPDARGVGTAPASGRHTRARLLAVVTLVAMLIGAGGVGTFVVLPRHKATREGGLNLFGTGASTVSGWRDHVQLGASGLISESREIVATVRLSMDGEVVTQPIPRYFRGVTLDQYSERGGKWERSDAMRDFNRNRKLTTGRQVADGFDAFLDRGRKKLPDFTPPEDPDRYPPGLVVIDQEFELVNKTSDTLFALAHPIQVAFPGQEALYMNPIDKSLQLRNRPSRQTYQVRSAVNYFAPPTDDEAATYEAMRYKSDNPSSSGIIDPLSEGPIARRVRGLAMEIMERSSLERDIDAPPSEGDTAIVRAFERYLSGACAYTLEMEAPSDQQDPTLYFLFESRRGHCEYFASALAALCRSVGIDARVVTGFVTTEVDNAQRFVIRQSHAHAWVEAPVYEPVVYYPGDDINAEPVREPRLLWEIFDPSPIEVVTGPSTARSGWADTIRMWVYSFEDLWVNSVIEYDADAQKDLLGISGEGAQGGLSSWLEQFSFERDQAGFFPGWVQRLIAPGLAVAGCVLVVFALRRIGEGAPAKLARRRDRRTHRAVVRIDRALRRLGAPRPASSAMLDHASEVGGDIGLALSAAARPLYQQRFGSENTDLVMVDDAIAALERLAKQGTGAT